MPNEVFVSYSHKDLDRVKPLIEKLIASDLQVWWDPNLRVGETWKGPLLDELASARCVLVVWSQHALVSDWILQTEALAGWERKILVSVLLDPVTPPEPFGRIQAANLVGWSGDERHEGFKRALERLRRVSRSKPAGPPLSKARCTMAIVTLVLVAFMAWYHRIGPRYSRAYVSCDVAALVGGHRWITYDPPRFNPSAGSRIDPAGIDADMATIRQAGFDGIIVFTARHGFSAIPARAKAAELLVIVTVWDPHDRQELDAAIRQRDYVDAYCVGHNGLGSKPIRYDFESLKTAMDTVRFRSRRPVSTTEPWAKYLEDERLYSIGDWVFADASLTFEQGFSPGRAEPGVEAARATLSIARQLNGGNTRHKPILLKLVTFPVGGAPFASPAQQAVFYSTLREAGRGNPPDLPFDVSISFHSAFDIPWKADWPFYRWDPQTGLIESGGAPRPAADAIRGR